MSTPRARRLRRDLTDTERLLWSQLRSRQIGAWKFRRQQPLGPYIADFVCFEARLIIELDGGQHAATAGVAADEARSAYLRERGFRVLRYWNHDVIENIDGVLEHILNVLGGESLSC